MTSLVPIALFGWIPIVLVMFALMRARTASLCALLGGVLFLPMVTYDLPGLPEFSKYSATAIGLILGVALFDPGRIRHYHWHWLDTGIAVWCMCPLLSSMTNGLGAYDGIASSVEHVLTWGIPYAVGRMYFSDAESLHVLLRGILIAGLLYVPLCLYEIRMSPQLHSIVYGMHAHSFQQTIRFGGYRPTVFMQHGLMVGFWMVAAALISLWMSRTRQPRTLRHVPMWLVALGMVVVAVLCKSLGALALLAIGMTLLLFYGRTQRLTMLWVVILVVPTYLAARVVFDWDGRQMVEAAAAIESDRADSLGVRLENEELLMDKALERPLFGWGGWNRARIDDVDTITDSLWIITLGQRGSVGLITVFMILLAGPVMIVLLSGAKRVPVRHPLAPIAVVLSLYSIDCLLNAMINPIYTMMAGATTGAIVAHLATRRKRSRRMARSSARWRIDPRPAISAGDTAS